LGDDHWDAGLRRHGRQECVDPANAGVTAPGTLFLVPVDLDDCVIDIHKRQFAHWPGRDNGRFAREVHQKPGLDGVQLTDVSEGERSEERAQRRRGITRVEDPVHPAVTQHGHVINLCRRRHRLIYADVGIMPTKVALVSEIVVLGVFWAGGSRDVSA